MAKEILINTEADEKQIAILKDNVLDEYYIERPSNKSIVGNIYKGKIDAVVRSIGAAFVDIGMEKKGFLYLSEIDMVEPSEPIGPQPKAEKISKEFKKGEAVLVQVVKEPLGTKGPRLTTHIGLAGRYLVLMPMEPHRGVSRRIEDRQEKSRLLGLLEDMSIPSDIGYIIRTVALGRNKRDLQRDLTVLLRLWNRIHSYAAKNNPPCLIYEEYDIVLRVIRDSFNSEVNKVITDSKEEFRRIRNFLRMYSNESLKKVEFFPKTLGIFAARDIDRKIDKIYDRRIYMKSGAYLVIEPTEGLVVIDVNSGRFRKKFDQEHMALAVNSEAAGETAKQLRLRDLGGIIVIDFIDMEREEHRREVLRVLKKAMEDDKAKYEILGISKFGVVEMTRERVYRTIESLSYVSCTYCQGRGKIMSVATLSISVLKQLKKYMIAHPSKQEIKVSAHADVINSLLKEHEKVIFELEKRFRTKVTFTLSPNIHIEEIKIE